MADEKIANRTAVALGNFDGMHVGHMAVLRAAKGFESKGLTPLALLFDEHSLKAITGTAPPMLMTADERNRREWDWIGFRTMTAYPSFKSLA